MRIEEDVRRMMDFTSELQMILSKSIKESDIDSSELLLLHSAVLLKTAVELYTIAFDDDDVIEKILNNAIDSISAVRYGNIKFPSQTVH